jgi:hypothetical protein
MIFFLKNKNETKKITSLKKFDAEILLSEKKMCKMLIVFWFYFALCNLLS